VSATVKRLMNAKGKHVIEVRAGGNDSNTTGAGSVCIYGFWSFETSQVQSTVFAA
jgi:hypothetical protein